MSFPDEEMAMSQPLPNGVACEPRSNQFDSSDEENSNQDEPLSRQVRNTVKNTTKSNVDNEKKRRAELEPEKFKPAPRKKVRRVTKQDFFGMIEKISPPAHDLSDPVQMAAAKVFYKTHGYVIVMPFRSEAERKAFCERCVAEIWNNLVNSAGYKPEIRAAIPIIQTQKDLDDFMGQLPAAIEQKMKTLLGDHLYFHVGFGATCYNTSWHSESAWKLRMDMLLASFVKTLMDDGEEAYFSIDRTISKWLNKGDAEFVHVDTKMGADKNDGTVNGKFCAVAGAFICTPGSHLLTEEVAILYPPIYKKHPKSSAKFALKPGLDDPLGLYSGSKRIIVPAGALILWHDNLFHGVAKNTSGAVQWGFYLGFTNNIFRTGLEYHKSGKSQIQDRYDSWRHGVRPLAHPSCDPTWLYPKQFQSTHGILGAFIRDKMDPSNPQYDFSQRMTTGAWVQPKTGGPKVWNPPHMVPHLAENPDPNYRPYPLSLECRALLVGKHNVDAFDWDFAGAN